LTNIPRNLIHPPLRLQSELTIGIRARVKITCFFDPENGFR
jgi:hypothetical protein